MEKRFSKFLSIIIVAVMLFFSKGCGDSSGNGSSGNGSDPIHFLLEDRQITVDGIETVDWAGISPQRQDDAGDDNYGYVGADITDLCFCVDGNDFCILFYVGDGNINVSDPIHYRVWFDCNRDGQLDGDSTSRQVDVWYDSVGGSWEIDCQDLTEPTPNIISATASAAASVDTLEIKVNIAELGLSNQFYIEAATLGPAWESCDYADDGPPVELELP